MIICICCLKEQAKGRNLSSFWKEFFSGLGESGSESALAILSAYRVRFSDKVQKFPRDIIVTFSNWEAKQQALELLG